MKTVTLTSLMTRARQRANMENSLFVSDSELTQLINESCDFYYDLLVQAVENYFYKEAVTTLVPGTTVYPLPADFYKHIAFDYSNGNKYETVFPFDELSHNAVLSVTSSIPTGTIRLRYVPARADLAAGGDTIDGVNGWDNLIVIDTAIKMLNKEESDTRALELERERQVKRIEEMSRNRSLLFPGKVGDVTVYDSAYVRLSLRYRFYGNNFEIMSLQFVGF